jgi:excisionase family DNA binding protein
MARTAVAVADHGDDLPLFMNVEQAARVIGISRSSAYDAIRSGELPAVRFGRRLRVPREALLAIGRSAATAEERG